VALVEGGQSSIQEGWTLASWALLGSGEASAFLGPGGARGVKAGQAWMEVLRVGSNVQVRGLSEVGKGNFSFFLIFVPTNF
jgi:hypothetical protein